MGTSFGDVAPLPSRRMTRKPPAPSRLRNLGTEPDRASPERPHSGQGPTNLPPAFGTWGDGVSPHFTGKGADKEAVNAGCLWLQRSGEGESSSRRSPRQRDSARRGPPCLARGPKIASPPSLPQKKTASDENRNRGFPSSVPLLNKSR